VTSIGGGDEGGDEIEVVDRPVEATTTTIVTGEAGGVVIQSAIGTGTLEDGEGVVIQSATGTGTL